jgi:hypothetical protein
VTGDHVLRSGACGLSVDDLDPQSLVERRRRAAGQLDWHDADVFYIEMKEAHAAERCRLERDNAPAKPRNKFT